jgi:hypothetical protein
LFDPANIHETVAVALSQPPSADKLTALTNGNSLAFPASRNYYQKLLAKRAEAERLTAGIGTNSLTAETEPSAAKI